VNYKPQVSIIVPIYNVEKYLRQCLDSIVGQTLKNIEIILINDGSKDGCLGIMQEYAAKDDRIIIIDKQNEGYGKTMNRGLEKASGEYIGIVESDDYVELDMFEKLYAIAKQHNVDVVKSNFYFYWSKPTEKNEKTDLFPLDCYNTPISPMDKKMVFFAMPSIWSAIYRRELLQQNGITFLGTPGASYQDTSFNFKVWACAKSVYLINDTFVHYRQDNENSSVNHNGKVFCVCDEYHEIERFLDERYELKLALETLKNRLKFNTYMWNYDRLQGENKKGFLKQMSLEFRQDLRYNSIDKRLFGTKEANRYLYFANYDNVFYKTYYYLSKFISPFFCVKVSGGFERYFLFHIRVYKKRIKDFNDA
jgi:glycosyltransferase involved in cell wall biosynthesis